MSGWVWWVRLGDGSVVGGPVDSGRCELSENILFVLAKTLYNGEKVRCRAYDTWTDTHVKVVQCHACDSVTHGRTHM